MRSLDAIGDKARFFYLMITRGEVEIFNKDKLTIKARPLKRDVVLVIDGIAEMYMFSDN